MRITIITPCWNAENLIADTVRSVADQLILADESVRLQYLVIDGASTDHTVDVVRSAWIDHPRSTLEVVSESDNGMYDALAKGLRKAEGDIIAYLNAGDYYSPHCLKVVRSCFDRGASWLTGMRVTYSADGALISAKVPYRYDRPLIRAGHYGVRGGGRFIQQESTFWSKTLLDTADLDRLSTFKLAGDLFLWTEFAKSAELQIVSAHLGGFRFHGGHLSDAIDRYREEARGFLERPRLSGYLRTPTHEVLSWIPVPLRRLLPGRHPVIAWDRGTESWATTG